jgi:hypothetical protein
MAGICSFMAGICSFMAGICSFMAGICSFMAGICSFMAGICFQHLNKVKLSVSAMLISSVMASSHCAATDLPLCL